MSSLINNRMTNSKVTGVPNVTTGVPDSPRKLDPFMRVPKTASPTARHVENTPRHHQAGLTDMENLT
ncbi:hypothetical protein GCM10009526_26940 [Glutamicibacter creatinolyticus]